LKIVFQLKLLNAQASPQLREPDNLRTFVSSPQFEVLVGVRISDADQAWPRIVQAM
jgi:hypothetical protein